MAFFEDRGMGVRVTVRVDGARIKATFDTRAEAEAWAADKERLKAVGELSASSRITVGELFEAFEDAVASKTDSARWNSLRIRNWCKSPLAAKRISALVTHDIDVWAGARLLEVSPATVSRELTLMSSAFTWAIKSRRWLKVNPCFGHQPMEHTAPRSRQPLTEPELAAIKVATGFDMDPELRTKTARVGACFLLALETGMRQGEILRLWPADYRREARTVIVAARERGGRKGSHSGRSRLDPSRKVPLTEDAVALLDRLLATMPPGQPYIVGVKDGTRDSLWRRAVQQSGVEGLTFHDSKHEACTRLAKFLDVLALSHAVGTKDLRLLRDTYYNFDASAAAALLPPSLSGQKR